MRYSNRAITTAKVIEELIGLAKTITQDIEQGKESGLSEEEGAFYQALADNASARELLKDDILKNIACELAESIKKKPPWTGPSAKPFGRICAERYAGYWPNTVTHQTRRKQQRNWSSSKLS